MSRVNHSSEEEEHSSCDEYAARQQAEAASTLRSIASQLDAPAPPAHRRKKLNVNVGSSDAVNERPSSPDDDELDEAMRKQLKSNAFHSSDDSASSQDTPSQRPLPTPVHIAIATIAPTFSFEQRRDDDATDNASTILEEQRRIERKKRRKARRQRKQSLQSGDVSSSSDALDVSVDDLSSASSSGMSSDSSNERSRATSRSLVIPRPPSPQRHRERSS